MGRLLRILDRIAHSAGFDVRRWPALPASYRDLAALLSHQRVDVLLDVGGNTGQFGQSIRKAGYDRRIVSFEPTDAAHQALAATARNDDRWDVAPPLALGARDGVETIHCFNRSDMNSLQRINGVAMDAFPRLEATGDAQVEVRRLDGLFDQYVGADERAFLKLDTQGSERAIIDGATAVLPRIVGIQAELPLVALYDGTASFRDMVDHLEQFGFSLAMTLPVNFNKRLGRQIETDAIFVRDDDATRTPQT